MNVPADNAGQLGDLFTQALEQDGADAVERHAFWNKVGESFTSGVAAIGIAAAPLTAGTSAAVGAGSSLLIHSLFGLDGAPTRTTSTARRSIRSSPATSWPHR